MILTLDAKIMDFARDVGIIMTSSELLRLYLKRQNFNVFVS